MDTPAFNTLLQSSPIAASFPTSSLITLRELPSTKVYFVDVNSDFSLNGKPEIITEDDAIRAQIRNILSTPLGSEHMEPEYGSMLPFRLFDPITAMTAYIIEGDTLTAVNRWMRNKITLSRQSCYVRELLGDAEGSEGYYISMAYTVNRTAAVVEYNFSIYR